MNYFRITSALFFTLSSNTTYQSSQTSPWRDGMGWVMISTKDKSLRMWLYKLFFFSHCCGQGAGRSNLRKEGFFWAQSLRVESRIGGKLRKQVTFESTVTKQKLTNAFLLNLRPEVMEWHLPHLGWVFPLI